MTPRPTHEEVQELLGAYALDAVDAEEAVLVEDHLRDCPRCRAEVAQHRETAALLANEHAEVPSGLWDRVALSLEEAPPPMDLDRVVALRPAGRGRGLRVASIAAAAAVVVALSVGVVAQDRRLDRVQAAMEERTLAAAALAAFDHPDAREVALRSDDGRTELRAVVLPDGTGYLRAGPLRGLATGRTYQLWAVVGSEAISAGVLGPDPGVVAFHVDDRTAALALTEERRGGAPRPTMRPFASGVLSA